MSTLDVPNVPPEVPPVLVAQATVASSAAQPVDRVIGVCHLSENPYDPTSAVNTMSVADVAVGYITNKENAKVEGQPRVSVLRMPQHGVLQDIGDGNFAYLPKQGYIGNDQASLLVEVGGKKIRMEYFFRVMQTIPQQYESEPSVYKQGYCPVKARVWKISEAKGFSHLSAASVRKSAS